MQKEETKLAAAWVIALSVYVCMVLLL